VLIPPTRRKSAYCDRRSCRQRWRSFRPDASSC
jgi:hypothetical protein